MNYFRCTVGSGKGNTVTVTCAEEFAGLTITLAKTGKTYTKTCPSTAPYVVTFYGVEVGTYTVSCTVDGQTYSETVIVQDISCVLNYGFKWQTWVDTASQLDSSDYDSLDEVLADEKALRELFLEHACVDYMAELTSSNEDLETVINNDLCAKWINLSDYALDFLHANEVIADLMDEADKYGYGEWALMPQVPKMTSNTAPYGTVSATAALSGNEAYKAFDGDDSTFYTTNAATVSAFVEYAFVDSVIVKKAKIILLNQTGQTNTYSVAINGSNDNTSWEPLSASETITITNEGSGTVDINMSNVEAYKYYKAEITSDMSGSRIRVKTLQFYAWAPKGNVPVMTSNTAPYGTVSASSTYSGSSASNAFDDNDSSYWYTNGTETTKYIQYKSTNPICVKRIKFFVNAADVTPSTAYFYGSNDGTTYDLLSTISFTSEDINKANNYRDIDNDSYYLYHKIQVNDNIRVGTDQRDLRFNTVQFYGRELKVSVPTMTSNTAPYGEAITNREYPYAYGTLYAYYAFDNSNSTDWSADSAYEATSWLGYKFLIPTSIKRILLSGYRANASIDQSPKDFKIQYSDNGVDFVTLSDETYGGNPTAMAYNWKSYDVNHNDAHKYWRLLFLTYQPSSNGNWSVNGLQFYGLDYSEKEFESGTTKKWLYDHGVELEELVYGSSVEKEDSQIVCIGNSSDALKSVVNTLNIDLTPYNLIRVVFGNRIVPNSGNNNCGSWFVSNQDNIQWNASTFITYKDIPVVIDNPNTFNLDISSVNASKKFGVGTAADANRRNSFKELWLE